jgi:hypothetical protein
VYNPDCGSLLGESSIILNRLLIPAPAAYSLFAAFAAGICLFPERAAIMRTICAKSGDALPGRVFLA